MNFSHGSYEYHQSVIDNTRKMIGGTLEFIFHVLGAREGLKSDAFRRIADPGGRPVAIALDTVCPVRLGSV